METQKLSKWLAELQEYLSSNPTLYQAAKTLLIVFLLFLAYRILKKLTGFSLGSNIPILGAWETQRQVRDLLKAKDFARAGERLLSIGDYEKAIETFVQGKLFLRAAEVHLRKGRYEQAASLYERGGELARAAELYLERKQYQKAEALLEKTGRIDELGDLYKNKGELALAAMAYIKAKQFSLAGNALVKLGKLREAAEAFLKGYELAKTEFGEITPEKFHPETQRIGQEAAKLLERTQQTKRAGELYLELRMYAEAVQCFAKIGDHKRAAEIAERIGNWQQASEFFSKAGDSKTAARIVGEGLANSGELSEAVSKFQEAEEFLRAAEIYLDLQETEKAAEMYERGEEYSLAATFYRTAGNLEKAAHAFEQAKQWNEAIACYAQGNMTEEEMKLREQIGDFVGMAQSLHRRGKTEEALKILERIPEKDSRYRSALSLKGRIYLDLGEPHKAKEFLDRAVSMVERLSGEDIDTIYNLAVIADQTQSTSNALEVLERMLVQDLVDKTALEKAQNVRKVLSDRAFKRMAMATGPLPENTMLDSVKTGQTEATSLKSRRYIPVKEIGRGGMGIVYTARDTALDRIVALKILPGSLKKNDRAVQTFLREAKAAAALNHPNIVTVHDTGIQDGEYYIAMEFIEGKTIKEIIKKRKKLSIASVVEVLKQLLAGLSYAHSKNIVHRDLTTNNIMWTQQRTVKIMDFGLAKVVKELMNEQSIIGGTPSFMSPEQTLGKPIDHRTDIYSLGVSIYEMCLGELPFQGGDLGYHHLHTPPPVPKEKMSDMPQVLSDMILKCMEKDPAQRFQSAAEIQEIVMKLA